MIFRQFEEPVSHTFSYLVGCEATGKCCLIDPVASESEAYLGIISNLGLTIDYTMDTHVHADHITAAYKIKNVTECKSILHKNAGVGCADRLVEDLDEIKIGTKNIIVRHTPGHTDACVCFVMDDRVFTGDTLLINGCGRTDFQGGDAGLLFDSIHSKLYSLADELLVYPGHDYNGERVSTIGKEKATNQRINSNTTRSEFIELMKNLKLPYPKAMETALPANLACGKDD